MHDTVGSRRGVVRQFALDVSAARSVCRHFIRMTMRDRAFTITAMIIPINYLFLFLITVINGAQDPAAIVIDGTRGAQTNQFIAALRSTDSFKMRFLDEATAERELKVGQVVALIRVPADFETQVGTGQPVNVSLSVDNVDNDFTDDVRRGLQLGIQRFVADNPANHVNVVSDVHADVGRPVPYTPYVLVSIVVVAIMIGGFFQGGVNSAREYETGTIVELAMAPVSSIAILSGMVMGTFVVSMGGVFVIMGLLVGVFGVRPAHWAELVGVCALLQLVFAAGGVLLGNAMRRRNGLSGLAILLSLPMLSLSGAFFPVSWSDPVIAFLAKFTPTYYANAVLQYVVHNVRTTPLPIMADVGMLVLYGVAMLVIASALLKRREITT